MPIRLTATEKPERFCIKPPENTAFRSQIIRLAEFDVTGAYAEQAAKITDSMNGNFIKERFYAIPLESLPRINSHNANPRMPFYH